MNMKKNESIFSVIDASNQHLGRLASDLAIKLRGKSFPNFRPNRISTDKIIVKNTDKIIVTGNKKEAKTYWNYSGYPGGMRFMPYKRLFARDSRLVLKRAVRGMLPKNKQREILVKNLVLYKGDNK